MKIYFRRQDLSFSSELLLLCGFVDKPQEGVINCNSKGEGRFDKVSQLCKQQISHTSNLDECDIVVFPQKYHPSHPLLPYYMTISKQHNKKLWCFYNDDNDITFNLPEYMILWRTSFNLSKKLVNELSIPAITADFYQGVLNKPDLTVGYCGHTIHGRKRYLAELLKSNLKTNFILRKGFWAPGVDKFRARKEYLENMYQNLFIFCYRGAGNFSYRFYETLMMGRIPILIDTDCVFPFTDKISINDLGIVIDEKKIDTINLIDEITKYYNTNKDRLESIQKNNRSIWINYYSAHGFVKTILDDFRTT